MNLKFLVRNLICPVFRGIIWNSAGVLNVNEFVVGYQELWRYNSTSASADTFSHWWSYKSNSAMFCRYNLKPIMKSYAKTVTVHSTRFKESRVSLASRVVANIISWYAGELGEAGEDTRAMPGINLPTLIIQTNS